MATYQNHNMNAIVHHAENRSSIAFFVFAASVFGSVEVLENAANDMNSMWTVYVDRRKEKKTREFGSALKYTKYSIRNIA